MHRYNIKGETHINRFSFKDNYVFSKDTNNIQTHVIGLDFNSLYPSSFSSIENVNNPYSKMYMPGRIVDTLLLDRMECATASPKTKIQKQEFLKILRYKDWIRSKYGNNLFIVEIKAHIDEAFINDYINFPPIFRKLDIPTDRETIGDYMYDYMQKNNIKTDQKESKLTMLLSTHNQFMSFSSYYLWFLLDYCHLIIDDIQSIIIFTKHDRFKPFVTEFMNKRIECINNKSSKEIFYKTCLNGSYGFDGMNTEKYERLMIGDASKAFEIHAYPSHVDTRKIGDDSYILTTNPSICGCKTCIQEAYFTLDNAKFWYLNFIYNFMYKCLDTERFHFIEGDTDSAYWAVAGDPSKDHHQGFTDIITNQEFYDKHLPTWICGKNLLCLAIEREDENCIALAPKCYTLFPHNKVTKMKGVSKSKNHVESSDYKTCIEGSVIKGKNINLQQVNHVTSKITVHKNALTACNTKAYVLPNESCCCFMPGVKYRVQYQVIQT
jgi:hypothetical protein